MKPIRSFFLLVCAVSGVVLVGMDVPCAYAWTDENPASASQCAAADVNDVGTVVENCKVSNASVPFVTVGGATTQLAALPATAGSVPCSVNMINNAAQGQETVVGACRDANNVFQAVSWNSGSPGSPTQLMPFSGLLGIIGGGVRTGATGVNVQGVVIGESVDGNGSGLPVYWAPNSGAATPLNVPLLAPQANCVPADINDAQTPSVVGNCPAGGGGGGKNVAVFWPTLGAAYAAFPVPGGASYCNVSRINIHNQILGECIYGTDTHRAVVWGPGGTGPTVLLTVNGGQALRTRGADLSDADLSDAGLVAVNFLAGSGQAGFYEPALWNPATSNASSITLPGGAIHGTVRCIGSNGKAVGNFETAAGDIHPFHVEPGSLTAIDDGSPAGGPNAVATACSIGGINEVITGESSSSEDKQVEKQLIP
ncbi:hypothetical protein [Paraburkholderia caffeinilytica]|uniref:hypothetical protein n=1 Tax=Paraburkholderia caffeinilytica TaxID=1761016 RepID=UPI003D9FC5F1